jgi:hypothetical protein
MVLCISINLNNKHKFRTVIIFLFWVLKILW